LHCIAGTGGKRGGGFAVKKSNPPFTGRTKQKVQGCSLGRRSFAPLQRKKIDLHSLRLRIINQLAGGVSQ